MTAKVQTESAEPMATEAASATVPLLKLPGGEMLTGRCTTTKSL